MQEQQRNTLNTADWLAAPIWKEVRTYWYWFLIVPTVALVLALVYLRYATHQYIISASLLIRDDSRGSDFRDASLLEGLGLPIAESSVENEIEILRSRTLLTNVVDNLHLNVKYLVSGDIKTAEIYEKAPFKIRFLESSPNKSERYQLVIHPGNTFTLYSSSGDFTGTFGDTILLPHGRSIITTTRYKPASASTYAFLIGTREEAIEYYSKALTISTPNKMASLVNLSLTDIIPAKGEAILKQLISDYQNASIGEKNRTADSTISFITGNLDKVAAELVKAEKEIERFRAGYDVIAPAEDSRRMLTNRDRYSTEEKDLIVKLKVLTLLEEHLHEHPGSILPSSLFPQESSLAELAIKYNELLLLRVKTLVSLPEPHPAVRAISEQIGTIRASLESGIQFQKKELVVSLTSARGYQMHFNADITRIPMHERLFLSKSREQSIQQELYLFLLKKRMETAISRSANIANARVIDAPKADPKPVRPNKELLLLVSFVTGILLPFSCLYVRQIFYNKVGSKDEVAAMCGLTVLAEISHHSGSRVVTSRPEHRSLITEQFRTLRTNIQFLTEQDQKVILLTSSMAGEGKSFVAMHLTQSLALTHKKVILVDFDLRKPALARSLYLQKQGISEYLISGEQPLIQQSGTSPSFDVLAAGEQHTNPADLLISPDTGSLIRMLREQYDYIFLDSPPIGLVSDARILSRHADMTLYIVRQNFTYRHQLEDIQKIISEHQLPGIQLIFNGVKRMHSYQYSYYSNENNQSIFKPKTYYTL
ncbi:GumC family protein [Dyadobacter sp. MSC1_007]|uniref:GumC family protein n=1 Tax=Dyadobacter sp. MSC1_007 TaxID=2909264 RepID=UPI00202E9E74|nr:polysaccharide biosynthesis tyrosine autokinase [Dyadobacter sp. MSC1_007]